jgi:hypothetical protein
LLVVLRHQVWQPAIAMRTLHLPLLLLAAALAGCPTPTPGPCDIGGEPGLTGAGPFDPFPSMHLVQADPEAPEDLAACRLTLPEGSPPVGEGDAMDVARFNRRDGFSPAGTIVWKPGVPLDDSNLPSLADPGASVLPGSPVQLLDLDTGERLAAFAELDAWPDQYPEDRVLLIRPVRSLGFQTHVAVVLTTALVDDSGETVASPSAFAAIRDGDKDGSASDVVVAHYDDLLDRIEGHGVGRSDVAFAWDFHTASEDNLRAPLDRVLDTMRAELPLDPAFAPEVVISDVFDADDGDPTPPDVWKEVRGSLRLIHHLWKEDGSDDADDDEHDVGIFRLDAEGLPVARGVDDAFFTAILPDSIRDAAPGTVPVLVFGHGIFASPNYYLSDSEDGNGTIDLCNRLAAVCIGGEWRGLTTRDVADALRVAGNLGRFPLITDKMVQGVSNQMALARAFRTAFVEQDWLQAVAGGSLVDASRIHYFGISLGGIEGATLMANSEVVEYGVLHVPGSQWATMLERSSHWASFEDFVIVTQPDPADRQRVYALTQLLWDPVDPVNHFAGLREASVLWQVSMGDEQVPNFTAWTLGRSVGVPLVGEPVEEVFGLSVADAPTAPAASGMAQFDGGFVRPADVNRPAVVPEGPTAHTALRHTDEVKQQVVAFFADGAEGTIVHPCDGPCVFDLTHE